MEKGGKEGGIGRLDFQEGERDEGGEKRGMEVRMEGEKRGMVERMEGERKGGREEGIKGNMKGGIEGRMEEE